jgi:hypothetical protein
LAKRLASLAKSSRMLVRANRFLCAFNSVKWDFSAELAKISSCQIVLTCSIEYPGYDFNEELRTLASQSIPHPN